MATSPHVSAWLDSCHSTRVAQDVYTEVAALVREKVAADAVAGHPWAPLLHDAIDRKLVRIGRCHVHEMPNVD